MSNDEKQYSLKLPELSMTRLHALSMDETPRAMTVYSDCSGHLSSYQTTSENYYLSCRSTETRKPDSRVPGICSRHWLCYVLQVVACSHTIMILISWSPNHGIWVVDWPPHSPSLNPIENFWHHLKHHLTKDYPNIYLQGRSQMDWTRFHEAIIHS